MVMDPKASEFRRIADEQGILLRAADEEESRYVFDLQYGAVVTSRHPTLVRQLLLLAEAVYGPDRGEARELSCLIARRLALESPPSSVIVWQSAARAHATAPPSMTAPNGCRSRSGSTISSCSKTSLRSWTKASRSEPAGPSTRYARSG